MQTLIDTLRTAGPYSAQANAAGDAATLQKVIEVVMFSADRIEKQLSDKDVF